MNDNKMGPVYFISLGPVTGSALGIIVSLLFPSLTLPMGIGLGAGFGLLVGTMLYNLFQKTDEDVDDVN